MNYFGNVLLVLWECVRRLTQEPVLFLLTLLGGVVLAAVCWWVCTHYARLWNLAFQITTLHQVLCAFAAILTLVFCILFVSLKYMKEIAQDAIDTWNHQVQTDHVWQTRVYTKLYYTIKATNQEDFRNFPPPREGISIKVPVATANSKRIVASVSANEALSLFKRENPYLSRVLSLPASIPEGTLVADENNFFARTPTALYPAERATSLTADQIKRRLDPETPKAVESARLILTACFLLAQAIPFLWIGFAAYRDLKVST
jgi:hypothetical protein